MTSKFSILWRGLAVALLVGSGLLMAPAAPAAAWDDKPVYVPCKIDPIVVFDRKKGESVKFRYDGDKQHGTVIKFFNKKRLEEHGHAWRYPFWTSGEGCELKYKIHKNHISIESRYMGGKRGKD